jgi:uncharacterized GH25 family protein
MSSFSRKIGFGLSIVCLFSLFLSAVPAAQAHELWVNASGFKDGLLKADLGYGHDFPGPEPIAAERLHIFKPLELFTPEKVITLDQVGENYAYQKKAKLKKGSFLVIGTYQPTFWSKGPGGWSQTDRIQRPDATYVEEAIMCAKTIVDVDGAADEDFIARPVGQRLEIVPQTHPAKVNVAGKFPLQVLCDGKPAKFVVVEATFAGFSDKDYKAFQGRTDREGHIDVIPLQAGYWIVKVKHAFDHPDKARADEVVLVSTLTFTING